MGYGVHLHGGTPPPLLALHGFTQTGAMYAELAGLLGRSIVAPDLPCHGNSRALPADPTRAVEEVAALLRHAGAPLPLLGYSMGGRIALLTALEAPSLVESLVLVSTSPGIEDPGQRAERRREDEALAVSIRSGGLDAFLDDWLARPVFAGLQRRESGWRAADRAGRTANTAAGLAAALLGLGRGAMESLWDRLGELTMPVLVVAGSGDVPYLAVAHRMAARIPTATMVEIPDCGHAVIGEQPVALAGVVAAFLAGQTPSQPVIDRT